MTQTVGDLSPGWVTDHDERSCEDCGPEKSRVFVWPPCRVPATRGPTDRQRLADGRGRARCTDGPVPESAAERAAASRSTVAVVRTSARRSPEPDKTRPYVGIARRRPYAGISVDRFTFRPGVVAGRPLRAPPCVQHDTCITISADVNDCSDVNAQRRQIRYKNN